MRQLPGHAFSHLPSVTPEVFISVQERPLKRLISTLKQIADQSQLFSLEKDNPVETLGIYRQLHSTRISIFIQENCSFQNNFVHFFLA